MTNQTTALARREQAMQLATEGAGEYHEIEEFKKQIEELQKHAIVLCPAISAMPPGWGVYLSVVPIDMAVDVYTIKDGEPKEAPGKPLLDKIAAAAGVSWDPDKSGRTDDGSDPYYCSYKAVGTIVDMDGQRRTIMGEREIDLRDGSAAYEAVYSNERTQEWKKQKNIRQQRLFILPMAESKARLRAIRSSLGIAVAYPPGTLETKPFMVAKPYYHGKTGDPAVDQEIAKMQAAKALGIVDEIYGGRAEAPSPPPKPIAPPALPAPTETAAPSSGGADAALLDRFELLADQKGRLGTGDGQMTRAAAEQLGAVKLEEAIGRLEKMQDPSADGKDPVPW